MALDSSILIEEFIRFEEDVFTVPDVAKFVRSRGSRASKADILDALNNSDFVFTLIDQQYVTRAGVFTGREFSFKPTKEEIAKKHVILGHRCMPFINPEISPDRITVISGGKIINPEPVSFSMNLALDVFALFGEGFCIPSIINDSANKKVPLSSVQYSLPQEVTLTSWSLDKICNGKEFKYGDRILCHVSQWNNGNVEMKYLPCANNSNQLSLQDIEREEWYDYFEKGLLDGFDTKGPLSSIEEQLALLFLEHQNELCVETCGSAEEFLKHTKKIGFSNYGVESRIWRNGETIPFIGKWNEIYPGNLLMREISLLFSGTILDAYIENYIYLESKKDSKKVEKKSSDEIIQSLSEKIFPFNLKLPQAERKLILLNMEKRLAIIEKEYDRFRDYNIAPLRERVVDLFSQVSQLVCNIAASDLDLHKFPQQELVILVQLFGHLIRIIEEIENVFIRDAFPVDDVMLSLNGMADTYDEIGPILSDALDYNTYNSFEIINNSQESKNE